MPELIEVERYRRVAEGALDRRIAAVGDVDGWMARKAGSPRLLADVLTGRELASVRRVGKLLVFEVAPGLPTLGLRFGMTGRLVVDGSSGVDRLQHAPARLDPRWDRFTLSFADGGHLKLHDPRRLGRIELDPEEGRLGPDASTVGVDDVAAALRGSEVAVKARIMDQRRIAGIGNLLADEILWRAGIDPGRPSSGLDPVEVEDLATSIVETVAELSGRGGSHTGDLQAARRPGGRCPLDGTPLRRSEVGGRTTWSCPLHQR